MTGKTNMACHDPITIDYDKKDKDMQEFVRKVQDMKAKTEAVKHDGEKPRMDLLPWEALEEVAKVLTFGAKKYADHNWRKGFAWSRLAAGALRHVSAYCRGERRDPETGLSHVAHAICMLLFLLSHEIGKLGTDDMLKGDK